MSLAAWQLLRHLCEYAGHHTQPTGRGCKDEVMASIALYPPSRRNVKAEPLKEGEEVTLGQSEATGQRFSRWFTVWPSTHVNAGQGVEVMPVSECERAVAAAEDRGYREGIIETQEGRGA